MRRWQRNIAMERNVKKRAFSCWVERLSPISMIVLAEDPAKACYKSQYQEKSVSANVFRWKISNVQQRQLGLCAVKVWNAFRIKRKSIDTCKRYVRHPPKDRQVVKKTNPNQFARSVSLLKLIFCLVRNRPKVFFSF